MARWCLQTGQAPDVWRHLTRLERRMFIDQLTKLTKR